MNDNDYFICPCDMCNGRLDFDFDEDAFFEWLSKQTPNLEVDVIEEAQVQRLQ